METYYDNLTAPSILALFETTKDQRKSFAEKVLNAVEEGAYDPLKMHLQLKSMENIINLLTDRKNPQAKRFMKLVVDEAEKRGKKFDLYNASFELRQTGVKYDYSKCGDAELIDMMDEAEELQEKIKAKQDFLKTVPVKGMNVLNGEGEVFTVYPPSKSGTDSVAVTLL